MKTKLVAVIALIFCAFMAEASKLEGNGNIITKEISVDNYSEIELGGNIEYSGNNFGEIEATRNSRYSNIRMDEALP